MIYFDGKLRPADDARLPVDDHGVAFGLGFFETFRTSAGNPVLWAGHRHRLLAAAATAGIDVPRTFLIHDDARLRAVLRELLAAHGHPDAVFRYTLTAGSAVSTNGRYPEPREWMSLRPLPPAADRVTLRVLNVARDLGEWQPRPKSINFANAMAGANELKRRGAAPSDEGLFLAPGTGFVVEAVRHNVVWLEGGRLAYPDPALGAIAGVGLQWLLATGIRAEARRADVAALGRADAVAILNSVRGITPVGALFDASERLLAEWPSPVPAVIADLQRQWQALLR